MEVYSLALAEDFVSDLSKETTLAFRLDGASDRCNVLVVSISAGPEVSHELENVKSGELKHFLEHAFEIGTIALDLRV